MAKTFAKLNADSIVENIIVADQSFIEALPDAASYFETFEDANGAAAKFYNYAMIGGTFDAVKKAFVAKRPFASWNLDAKFIWQPPVAEPATKAGFAYFWDESSVNWKEVELPNKEYPTDGKTYKWDFTTKEWIEVV
jgi:hypothetical protein